MKNIIFIATFGSVLALSGCGSTSAGGASLSNLDFQAMSCEDINQAFKSYQTKRNTVRGLTSLASTLGVNKGGVATQATVASDQVYYSAADTARPIAQAKGCTPTF